MNKFMLAIILIMNTNCLASDSVSLNFSGNIRVSTCNISSGNTVNIDLKEIPAMNVEMANSASPWKYFSINFTNCSTAISQIKMTFTGVADAADISSLYKNQGTAKNIAVQLENEKGDTKLGNQRSLYIPLNGKSSISTILRTRAFSVSGNGMPGSISSKITANIIYL